MALEKFNGSSSNSNALIRALDVTDEYGKKPKLRSIEYLLMHEEKHISIGRRSPYGKSETDPLLPNR